MEKRGKTAYTLIGEGAVINGEVVVPHAMRVDGTITGKLEVAELLTVGAGGVIEADVVAKSAVVGGTVKGNVVAYDRIELESKATLIGDLRARHVVINEGAVFHGKCTMQDEATEHES